jgi:choline dehydrogenase
VEAMGDIGIPYNPEMNAGDHVGAKRQTLTSDGSKRASAYDAYYLPVKGRSNLQVVTYGQVQGVLFSEGEIKAATGIALADQISGRPMIVNARKEVIMAAGVFHTPQLLMLSVSSDTPFYFVFLVIRTIADSSGYRSGRAIE